MKFCKDIRIVFRLLLAIALCGFAAVRGFAQTVNNGMPVLSDAALLATPVGGLDATAATAGYVAVSGEPFDRALRVRIGKATEGDTNVTQLCLPAAVYVKKGDALLASFYVQGANADRSKPAQMAFLFERSRSPWAQSVLHGVVIPRNPTSWKRIVFAFAAAQDYPIGQAMVSLRFAFGPQTIEVGGLSVVDLGANVSEDKLADLTSAANPLGHVAVNVNRAETRQTLAGFGGDFCNPRFGSTEPMDKVGNYILAHLAVSQARVGIPLNVWAPQPGVYRDDGAAHAALLQMQILARRHIPIIGTVWEGPTWLLPGRPEEAERTLAPDKYSACIDAIAQFLVTARDRYGVTVADFSFNEADYGVNFRFTPAQISSFIEQAGPRFRSLGLKTKFLFGDTTGGRPFAGYVRPMLADSRIIPYLGAFAFHCWDVLDASDDDYRAIAEIGKSAHKPIWCTEAGFDSALWQAPNAWPSWGNGLNTARAYAKALRLSGASSMDYWTYEDNYPLVSSDGLNPFPVFSVIDQMQRALPSGVTIVATQSGSDDIEALASIGPTRGRYSVLLVNSAGPGEVALSGLPPHSAVSVYVSDANARERKLDWPTRTSQAGALSLALPQRCVVTVIGRGE